MHNPAFVLRSTAAGAALLLLLALPAAALRAGPSSSSPSGSPSSLSVAFTPTGSGLVELDLRQPAGYLKRQLLEFTPRGSRPEGVADFLTRRLYSRETYRLGLRPVRVLTPTRANPNNEFNARARCVVAFLGYRHGGLETTRTSLSAYYFFDQDDRLVDLRIARDLESL